MKISKKRAIEIIQEELEKRPLLVEANPSHRRAGAAGGKGGQFTKRGAGNIYSLSDDAKDNIGKDSKLEVPARGIEKADGGVGSVKYGANTSSDPKKQCGRKEFTTGRHKTPTRSCSNYPELYELLLDDLRLDEDSCSSCIQNFLARIHRANVALKQAQSGKEK